MKKRYMFYTACWITLGVSMFVWIERHNEKVRVEQQTIVQTEKVVADEFPSSEMVEVDYRAVSEASSYLQGESAVQTNREFVLELEGFSFGGVQSPEKSSTH